MSDESKESVNPTEVLRRSRELTEARKRTQKAEELLEILPQGHGSGLNADMVDNLHASEILAKAAPGGAPGGGGGGADEKVKISKEDTETSFLESKIVAGEGIIITKQNPGGDEQLEITKDPASDMRVQSSVGAPTPVGFKPGNLNVPTTLNDLMAVPAAKKITKHDFSWNPDGSLAVLKAYDGADLLFTLAFTWNPDGTLKEVSRS